MPPAALLLTADLQLPLFLQRGQGQVVALPVYSTGAAPLAPSSGTLTIYDAGKVVVVTGAVTVTDSVATFDVTALMLPATLLLSDQWQAEWALTFGAQVETFRVDVYLCLRLLHPVVGEAMLRRRIADLSNLKHANLADFGGYITEAWGIITRRLLQNGKRPYLSMNEYAFADYHFALSAGLIFQDASTYMGEGRYSERAAEYMKEAEEAWDRLRIEMDLNETNQRTASAPSLPAQPVIYGNFQPAQAYRRFMPPGVRR